VPVEGGDECVGEVRRGGRGGLLHARDSCFASHDEYLMGLVGCWGC
jgi:hypothetical protein